MSAAITAAVGGAVVGSLLADDYGAEGANDAAAANTRLQSEISREQWDKYKEIYEPLEKEMVAEAQNYDTPERRQQAASAASATVSQQFSKSRDQLTRQPGLDPSSAAFQAGAIGLNLAQAATDSTQQNAARKGVEDTGYARKQGAVAMGKGLDSTAASGLASAANSSLAQAQAGMARSAQEAQAIGSLTGKVISAVPGVKSWLNTPSSSGGDTGASATEIFDT
jgi:hypothetical protein